MSVKSRLFFFNVFGFYLLKLVVTRVFRGKLSVCIYLTDVSKLFSVVERKLISEKVSAREIRTRDV